MTPPTRSAATPASNALPPRVRTSNAAADVSGWPADTAAWGPITGGRSAALAALPQRPGVASPIRAAVAAKSMARCAGLGRRVVGSKLHIWASGGPGGYPTLSGHDWNGDAPSAGAAVMLSCRRDQRRVCAAVQNDD